MSSSPDAPPSGDRPASWQPFKRWAGPPSWYPRPPTTQQERQYRRRLRSAVIIVIGVALIALTEQFARPATDQLSFSTTWSIALAYAVPILMPAMGGIFAERAGVVNIGLEGMLVLGTWFGAWGALEFGPWWGVLIGAAGGAVGGLLHAIATVSFGVDHIISGAAILVMAPGITRFLSDKIFQGRPGGGITQSPRVEDVDSFSIPFLAGGAGTADALGRIESWNWFWISDAAGILRGFLWNVSWLTLIAYATVPISVWLLWRTSWGLRLRSCGEHPIAADSLGVDVYRYKYYGVVLSGAFAGYGGAFLVIELTGIYREGQTAGRGFIGLATTIFGNWRPVGAALGGLLFGFTDTLQLRDRPAVHGLLLMVVLALGLMALVFLVRRRYRAAAGLAIAAGGFAVWHYATETVPKQFPQALPYITVLLVLLFYTSKLRMPAADGMRYRRGQQQ
ncbi:MAG: ABC transporter permease [bacterium]|nr:ABC transporter permease [bacterium]